MVSYSLLFVNIQACSLKKFLSPLKFTCEKFVLHVITGSLINSVNKLLLGSWIRISPK